MKKNAMCIVLPVALLVMPNAGAGEPARAYGGGKTDYGTLDGSGANASRAAYGLDSGNKWGVESTVLDAGSLYDASRRAAHSAASDYGLKVFGLGLKVGLPMNSLMPYAKLGYAHVDTTGIASGFGRGDVHGGLGLEYRFAPNWSVAGEWAAFSPGDNGGLRMKNENFTVKVRVIK